jgi:anti-sigma regulatory factor (Ser/Thr protein kinase)
MIAQPTPSDVRAFTVDMKSLGLLRKEISDRARRFGLTGAALEDLVLIANELATNIIRHGGGRGLIWLWRNGTAIYCRAADRGRGIPDPQAVGTTRVDPNAPTGRGLWLIRQLSQRVHIRTGPTGTTVTVAVAV